MNKNYPAAVLYDEDIRRGSIEDMMRADEEQRARIIEEGEKLVAMTATPGWKIFEADIRGQIEAAKEALVDLDHPDLISKQQILCRALSNVLGTLYSKISEANALRSTDPSSNDEG